MRVSICNNVFKRLTCIFKDHIISILFLENFEYLSYTEFGQIQVVNKQVSKLG